MILAYILDNRNNNERIHSCIFDHFRSKYVQTYKNKHRNFEKKQINLKALLEKIRQHWVTPSVNLVLRVQNTIIQVLFKINMYLIFQ